MSHDHCDCVEGLEEHIAWQRDRLAEQDARGLRLAEEVERLSNVINTLELRLQGEDEERRRLAEENVGLRAERDHFVEVAHDANARLREVMSKQTGT